TRISLLLLYYNNVHLSFSDMATVPNTFKGKKKGKVILTQYRVLFLTANRSDPMRSFSMPFQLIRGSNVEQNLFSPNQVTGKIMAENGGGWEGTATFKLIFNSGGATEFMRLMALTPQFVGYMPPPPPPPGKSLRLLYSYHCQFHYNLHP
uniref:GRAM domain-containing protein n=1 Tax=Callorhinchus milii TaxID=7868 RepID=A0A4W3I1F4_CALMI